MKNSNVITSIFAALVCAIIFASAIHAQEKTLSSGASAISNKLEMINAFGYENSGQIRDRLDNLLKMLRGNPAAKGYIINYGSRADKKFLKVRRTQIDEKFALRPKNLINRVTVIDGGYREDSVTELWISANGSQKPALTPTVDEKSVGISKTRKTPTRRKRR